MRFGVTEAVIALAGRLTAFVVMLALAAAGPAAVLTRSQTVFELVKWAGVAYLAYLGLRSLLARPAADGGAALATRRTSSRDWRASSRRRSTEASRCMHDA